MPSHQTKASPDSHRETFPAVFENRLPLLVRLREFWQSLPARAGARELSRGEFERTLAGWVSANCEALAGDELLAHLTAGSTLLIFDGVDEVPLAIGEGAAQWFPRALVLSGLANSRAAWNGVGNRLLVTSRPYGVTAQAVAMLGLSEAPLHDLDAGMRELLIRRWFRQLRPGDEGEKYAADLSGHLREHTWLEPLAVNPLLLTGMCIVFDEGGRLPQDKHDLYLRIVNTVLNSRYRDDTKERDNARYRLQAIAYGMHTGHGLGETRVTPEAEASHAEVDRILREYLDKSSSKEEGNVAAITVREELLSQSGLFMGRGDGKAGFYHLSFQEFLAGQRLADVEDDLLPVFLQRAETPEWHNTLSLLFASLTREKAARLVTRLVEQFDSHGPRIQEVAADCLDILMARGARLDDATEQRCRKAFLATMVSSAPAVIRCRVGTTLGWLGDPRFHDESLWCLPRDPMLGFVEVPAGDFVMGANAGAGKGRRDQMPQHIVQLPRFFIARYPVTNAQFAAFATSDSAAVDSLAHDYSIRPRSHPADEVTWHDALAYCRWLDASLRQSPDTPAAVKALLAEAPWQVCLPSEAEWERAARGVAGRDFPWGNEAEFDRVNIAGRIGSTSPVGAFPRGSTSDLEGGIADLIGNVWEWTRSLYQSYPYRLDDGREALEIEGNQARVERGGGFEEPEAHGRAVTRFYPLQSTSLWGLGFRVVLTCFTSAPASA